jgi:hypothetical protein
MRKNHYWGRIVTYVTTLSTLLFVGSAEFAHAQTAIATAAANWFGYHIIGNVAYGIGYIIAWIGGVIIAIDAWLVGAMLGLNNGVFQSAIVQKGFAVTLSIANLGFVLGIIIVAVATILRRETYGYKAILWKLIVAAILVNFSLVIAAPIFNLGNSFSIYFLNCVDPSGGGCSGKGAGVGLTAPNSMNDFASNLAGAFNPQVALITSSSSSIKTADSISLGNSLGDMLVPIMSIVFVAFELVAIAIVLAALVVMLLIRYIYIAILAILMPFAWLGWVFPGIKDWWSKWWSNFFRWTFFSPIVLFFLWLAMATMNSMRNGTAIANQQIGTYTSTANNPIVQSLSNLFKGFFTPIIGQALSMVLMLGLTIGGLIVADKMSITGAGSAVKAAQGVGKSVQGFVGKQGKKAARTTYQRIDQSNRMKRMTGGRGLTATLQSSRIPGVSILGRSMATTVEKGGKDLVNEASKEASGKSSDRLALELQGFLGKEKQFAYLTELQKRADLDKVTTISGKNLGEFIDKNKTAFDQYEQGKLKSDINKSIGSDEEMRSAAEAAAAAAPGTPALAAAVARLDAATENFNKNMSASDIQKGQIESMFLNPATAAATGKSFGLSAGAYKAVQDEHVYSMGKHASTQTLSSFHGKLAKGGQQAQFDTAMTAKVASVRAAVHIPAGIPLTPVQKNLIMNTLFSPTNRKWVESTAAQNMGIDPANWGIV